MGIRLENDVEDHELAAWRVVGRRQVADCSPWLKVWAEDLELPDGRLVEGFYTIESPDYVAVVAFDEEERVVALRAYKHGPRTVSIGLPAGAMEPGEEALSAAKRELLEEAGYEAGDWVPLGRFASDGNRGAGTAHLFVARGARQVAEPASGDLEEMRVCLMTIEELLEATTSGAVTALPIAAAIGLAAARIRR